MIVSAMTGAAVAVLIFWLVQVIVLYRGRKK